MTFARKYKHSLKQNLISSNMEGAMGADLKSLDAYVVADKNKIDIYDRSSLSHKQSFTVPAKEGVIILYIAVSHDDTKIGLTMGMPNIDGT